jgi:hypothetical protein
MIRTNQLRPIRLGFAAALADLSAVLIVREANAQSFFKQ